MDYQLSLTDSTQSNLVVLTLSEQLARRYAIDVVLDVIGAEDLQALVDQNILAAGQMDELRALQEQIFDRDGQGMFIREGVYFTANGRDLNPDAPLADSFAMADKGGVKYYRCDLAVHKTAAGHGEPKLDEYSLIFFLHQIAIGQQLDVTKDYPELSDVIAKAEADQLVEIDVKKASYKLTEKGKSTYDGYVAEAQDLIKRFDIFGDVDVDSSGTARFDTGLGRDLRIPVFELEGVDPFRARFLLGINDGEWDKEPEWVTLVTDPQFYEKMMEPVERAPSVDEIGRNRLQAIVEQGKAALRSGSPW